MSFSKTPELPKGHPLTLLLARSQRNNKLPSCSTCKHSSPEDMLAFDEADWKKRGGLQCQLQDNSAPTVPGMSILAWGDAELMVHPDHFCAAWDIK